ncbi:MAG: S-methyl-5-thioribose-1-phosphate isomerase, partial [Melioribacteraceae bacterium]|nr:S-methyl-5-thioribose-1-phosphate isomerase [Melioribacteraceae bacterium]
IETDDYERIAIAIERLEVRGAPAIGIAAAYALALASRDFSDNSTSEFYNVYDRLSRTRPTAVNLFWALDRLKKIFEESKFENELSQKLLNEARKIHAEDFEMCNSIAENGLSIFDEDSRVLTHCNTGRLATGGDGTAFNVIRQAFEKGKIKRVHADETRPLLQGARLTAFELSRAGIPFSINTDSAAAVLFQKKLIDLVIVGADRIALNGDSANKIGTFNLAILADYHDIPFYIAAPTSTIDTKCNTGNEINIEFRDKKELNSIAGVPITSDEYDVYAPAFDVTPNSLISGIITEIGLHRPPFNFKSLKN